MHERHWHGATGEVRAVVDLYWVVVAVWLRRKQRWDYRCFHQLDWEYGLLLPGRRPRGQQLLR